MTDNRRTLSPLIFALVVLISGATAGAIFGERSVPEEQTELMVRSAKVVNLLLEWLPTEHDPSDIVYDGIGGMLEVLDPHSNFLDPRSFHKMRSRQEGSFFGVGIIISRRNGKITVIAPMAGTPAAAKGLRTGDVISSVEDQPTEGLDLDDVVALVRGPEGTTVNLTIDRPGMKESFSVAIERTRIPQNTVRFAFMAKPEAGYIRLSEFTSTSTREVREAIERLQGEGMKSLVFDLRNNPGGSLDAAIGVADAFLAKGDLIVTTKGRTPSSHTTLDAPGNGTTFEGPVVVLVNEGSASASEIVAGAIQDHDRGIVLGDVTWGKGLVQTVFSIRDTGLALTTARYYTPSGRCIQRDFESYIDYITHRNGVDAGDGSAPAYTTDSGRTVLGGGGVAPDSVVEARVPLEQFARLIGRSAFFRFAVELLKAVPEDEQDDYARSFSLTDEVLARFWSFVTDNEILTDEDLAALRDDPQGLDDVRRTIHVEVLNATVGFEAGYRVNIEGDGQLQAAIDALAEAEELWHSWKAARDG